MRGRTGLVAVATATATLGFAGAVEAKTFEVTRANDPNPGKCKPRDCSLREAVSAANQRAGTDTIVLPDRRYSLTRANPGGVEDDANLTGDLDVNNDPLTLTHPGKGRATIDAGGNDSAFDIFDGARTTMKKLGITDGSSTSDGGGITTDAPLTLLSTKVFRNETTDDGGGIDSNGNVKLVKSVVTGNEAGSTGGGLDPGDGNLLLDRSKIQNNQASEEGGGIDADGDVTTIRRSTIAKNRAGFDGGGIDMQGVRLRVLSSTLSGNISAANGGGIMAATAEVEVENSTLAGNRANNNGGGIYSADGASVDLNAVTVARNNSGADDPGPAPTTGGGLYQIDSTFTVRNSLIALNTIGQGGISRNDCEGETFTSLGHNLLSTDVECDGFTAIGDLVRNNPRIGKLAQNGGPTKTIALKGGSAAVGAAHKPSAPDRDQRGRKRDSKPDIGAFERGA